MTCFSCISRRQTLLYMTETKPRNIYVSSTNTSVSCSLTQTKISTPMCGVAYSTPPDLKGNCDKLHTEIEILSAVQPLHWMTALVASVITLLHIAFITHTAVSCASSAVRSPRAPALPCLSVLAGQLFCTPVINHCTFTL